MCKISVSGYDKGKSSFPRKEICFRRTAMKRQTIFILQELSARELKRKYSRSRLGILWSVLNPLLSMAVLSFIFSAMFRKSIENYPVYYLTGFLIWNFFTTATNTAMTSLADNQTLLLQIRLPKSVFPLSRVFTAFLNFLYSLAAYVLILAFFSIKPSWTMALFPAVVFFVFLFSLGMSYILSVLYVFFGDIRHLYGVFLTLWMYLSALFYPLELLPEIMQRIIWQNPIYNFIYAARACILYHTLPPWSVWVKIVVWSVGLYLAGVSVFQRSQNQIVQRL